MYADGTNQYITPSGSAHYPPPRMPRSPTKSPHATSAGPGPTSTSLPTLLPPPGASVADEEDKQPALCPGCPSPEKNKNKNSSPGSPVSLSLSSPLCFARGAARTRRRRRPTPASVPRAGHPRMPCCTFPLPLAPSPYPRPVCPAPHQTLAPSTMAAAPELRRRRDSPPPVRCSPI